MFVLKCCSELMSLFARINASQPNNWRSVFETAKGNVFKSFVILGIRRFALDGFAGPYRRKQNRGKKLFLPSYWYVLRLSEILYPGSLQQIKPGPIVLNRRQKGNPRNGTVFNLPGRKFKHFPSPGKVVMTVFWEREGVIFADAMQRGETDQLRRLNQEAYRTQEAFQAGSASQ
jgi:hypothetical protein